MSRVSVSYIYRYMTSAAIFVVGPARAPPINKIKEQLGMSGVKHVSPTTELRGGFPVYATQSQLVTPAVVDSIAAVLRTALPLGVWANAMAAAGTIRNSSGMAPTRCTPGRLRERRIRTRRAALCDADA